MRILVAEDDFVSRKLIEKNLEKYGVCDLTVDGMEAIEAFILALDTNNPYELICLDIMMPKVDGIKALRTIRDIENKRGIEESKKAKIIVITALGFTEAISSAFETGLEAYVSKPINFDDLIDVMQQLGINLE